MGLYWSSLEQLTREETDRILEADHPDVKVVVSHTCPSSFDMSRLCNPHWGGENKQEPTRIFLQEILEKYRPEQWFFGHWHGSETGEELGCKWRCLNIAETYNLEMK